LRLIDTKAHFQVGEFVRTKRSEKQVLRPIQTGRDLATRREFSIFNDL
jgi:hypothetical protein